jgi:hypothetical protein
MDKAPTEMFDIYSKASVAMMLGRNKRRARIDAKITKLYHQNNLTNPVCNMEVYNRDHHGNALCNVIAQQSN